MKYDITKAILDPKGQPFKDTEEVTVKIIIERILLSDSPKPGQNGISTDEKNRRFKLWRKVSACDSGELELTVDEINTVREAAFVLSTIFYGQLIELLDAGK